MDISRLFSEKSDIYAQSRPLYPQAFYDWVRRHARNHDTVWDCATGNGQAALGLSAVFRNVEATDISQSQLKHAFAAPNIRYRVSPAEQTPFDGASFDMVNVAQALHWFEIPAFFAEVQRVIRPGGLLAVSCYSGHHITPEIDAVVFDSVNRAIAPYWSKENQMCWDRYASVDFPFQKLNTPEFVMTADWDLNHLFGYLHSWSATRRCMEALGMTFFEDAYARVQAVWGDSSEARKVTFPLSVTAGYIE